MDVARATSTRVRNVRHPAVDGANTKASAPFSSKVDDGRAIEEVKMFRL
jgi:hypothetical protein